MPPFINAVFKFSHNVKIINYHLFDSEERNNGKKEDKGARIEAALVNKRAGLGVKKSGL